MTALVRLKQPAAGQWLAECEAALSVAVSAADLDAVVIASENRGLARHGLRVVDAAPSPRRRSGARLVSRGVGFSRSRLSP